MKKLLFQIMFLLLVIPAFSQGFVTVNGTVTDITTGTPIANHAVTIQSDSTTGFIYYQTVYTNASGFYSDTVIVTLGVTGTLFIRTYDCNNVLHQDVFNYTPYQSHTSTFVICNTNTGGCQAAFTYSAGGSNLVQFTDQSTGSPSVVAWSWAFGDPLSGVNNVSNLQNPVHIYGAPGTYTTCLTIQSANGCSNTTCQTIVVNATGGCQAAYTYVNTGGTQYQFNDQSSGNIISWLWNFGDPASGANGTSTAQNPTHTYSSPGIYTTCLTVHGSDSTCYDVVCQTIVAGSGGNCQAQFSYIIPLGGPPTVVEFTDLSTTASGAITTWIWNFGDGSVQTVSFPGNPNVSHTYAQNGNYAVCLTIHGTDSTCFDTKCDTLFLGNSTGCHANFYTSVPTPANSPVLFMDASTTGGSGQIASWNWNFGDPTSGSANTSTLQNPSHTYISAGSYTVCLTIHGADSTCYDMICKTVIVEGNQGCQANFSYTCTAPTFTNVQFTDLSTGNPTGWMWNFGDGTASTLQNPAHTFATAGNFNVCLTITGNNCTSTFCRIVVVSDSTNYHQLYGQVFAGTFPVSLGMVMIFSFDTTANYQPFVEVSPIDSNGVYYFTLVPDGNYYILAIPFDSNGFLPTYYGNVISWQQASLISLGTPANPYNISLVPSDQMTGGPGSASGQVNMGDMSSAMLDKINMILKNSQGQPIGFTRVSTSGAFSFPTLAYGTYWLHPEMPGVSSDNIMIVLTPEKPHADVTMTYTGHSILGIGDAASIVNNWSVFPNPVGDKLSITVELNKGAGAVVGIYNMSGQLIYSKPVELNRGGNVIEIPTSSLPFGIYTLRINSPEGINLISKLVRIN